MIDASLAGIESALRAVARVPFYVVAEALIAAAEWIRAVRLRRHWA